MSAHEDCAAPGKFSCRAEEFILDLAMDDGAGEGDIESPVAWFAEVTLDDDDPSEAEAERHFGTRWLVVREFDSGRITVECYATEDMRHERLKGLREEYRTWDLAVL